MELDEPSELDFRSVMDDLDIEAMIKEILVTFLGIKFTNEKEATRTSLVQCKLWMKMEKPFRTRVRPLNPEKLKYLKKEVEELLQAGVIRLSKSVYASAPVLVRKKDGTWRVAIDYRDANRNSEDFLYPLPRISDLLDNFKGAAWFTSLDLARGYWQIEMSPESIPYTVFVTPFGQYEFNVMPFG